MELKKAMQRGCIAFFKFNRKFRRNFLLNKNLTEGCTAHGREVCLAAPLAHVVCASTHFSIFLVRENRTKIGDFRMYIYGLSGSIRVIHPVKYL